MVLWKGLECWKSTAKLVPRVQSAETLPVTEAPWAGRPSIVALSPLQPLAQVANVLAIHRPALVAQASEDCLRREWVSLCVCHS